MMHRIFLAACILILATTAPANPGPSSQAAKYALTKIPWLKELGKKAMWAVFEGIVTGGVEGVVSEGIVRHGKMPEPKHEPPHNKPPVERKRIEDIQKEFGSGIGSNLIPPLTQPDKKKAPSFNSEDKIIEGFRLGRLTRPDLPRSVPPPVQIEAQTDPIEAFRRGYAYDTGMGAIRRDPVKAEEWYKKAAKRGHVGAQYYLAQLYHFGAQGVPADDRRAINWLTAAAERGLTPAQRQLGSIYENGEGVRRDPSEAAFWYAQAAYQGDPYSQYFLSRLYYFGVGVRQSDDLAFDWLNLAVTQGYPPAIDTMDNMLESYFAAARDGDPWGEYHFGRACDIGVMGLLNPNINKAAYWYDRAARKGHPGARRAMNHLCDDGWILCY